MKTVQLSITAILLMCSSASWAQQQQIPGGSPGNEIVITSPGSYLLTGNRYGSFSSGQPNQTVRSVIRIQSNDVVLDLGGFTIGYILTSCSSGALPVTCSVPTFTEHANNKLLHGVSVAPGVKNVRIKNGSIVGSWSDAVRCNEQNSQCIIEDVSVRNSNGDGLALGQNSQARRVTIENTVGTGIKVSTGSVVESSTVRFSNDSGVSSFDGRLTDIAVSDVGQNGILVFQGSLSGCSVMRAGARGVSATKSTIENCAVHQSYNGAVLGSGSNLRASTIQDSAGLGISGAASSSYSGIVLSGNNGGGAQASGPVSSGDNLCNGVGC